MNNKDEMIPRALQVSNGTHLGCKRIVFFMRSIQDCLFLAGDAYMCFLFLICLWNN